MVFLADDSAVVSALIDVVGKILLPVLVALCTTSVALYAIYKTDQRERHKRRRDAVSGEAIAFLANTDEFDKKCIDLYFELTQARDDKTSIEKFSGFYNVLAMQTTAHYRKLSIMGEDELAQRIKEYGDAIKRLRIYFSQFLKSKNKPLSPAELEELREMHFEAIKTALTIARLFKEEIKQLDRGSYGLLDKVFSKF